MRSFENCYVGWIKNTVNNFLDNGPKYGRLYRHYQSVCAFQHTLLTLSCSVQQLFNRQVGKLSKIWFKFIIFWGPKILGEWLPKFLTQFLKLHLLSNTWEGLVANGNGRGTSEIAGQKEERRQQQNISDTPIGRQRHSYYFEEL